MIARRLKSAGFFKKKLNKKAVEIIRNLELLVFLDKKNIIDFESIIIKEISKIKNSSKFINYLKNYIFKIINNGYNYSKIINEYLEGNNRSIEKLYLTNNICESINSKINFYLPKRVTSNYDFVNTLSKVFINNTFDNKTIKRHDYITRTLIKIIQDEKLNYKLNWITFDQFKSKEKYIISGREVNLEEEGIEKLIELLNDFNLEGENEENNKNDFSSKSEENNNKDNIEDVDNALANQDINKTNIQLNINEDCFSFNEIDTEKSNINDKEGSSDDIKNLNIDIFDEDMDIELFIGDNNYDLIDNNNDENYFKSPLRNRIKNRLKEEKKKPRYKAKKRKNADSEEDDSIKKNKNKNNFKCKKKYPK